MDTKTAERGSAKLFALEPHDHEGIARALGVARGDYEVKWWWKYGQPAIDRIRGSLEVKAGQLGHTVAQLMELNGRELQVTAECFPYGIPKPEVFRIEVEVSKAL